MPASDRVNQRDPSGMRSTEERRAKQAVKDLDAAIDRVLEQVRADSTPAEIRAIVDRELDGYTADAKRTALKWVEDTQQRSIIRAQKVLKAEGIKAGAVLGPAFPLPSGVKDAIAISVEQEIDSLSAEVKKKLTSSLIDGIQAGEGARDLGKRVSDDLAMPRVRAELIARTETMRSLNSTSLEAYKRVGVKRVMWYAAMDSRSCDICGELHLQVFDIDKVPPLPRHPRCRCTTLPQAD